MGIKSKTAAMLLAALAAPALTGQDCVRAKSRPQETIVLEGRRVKGHINVEPSKKLSRKVLTTPKFDGVASSPAINVVYTPSAAATKAVLEAPENLMGFIDVKVVDGVLKAEATGSFSKFDGVTLTVSGRGVTRFKACGPSSVSVSAALVTSGDVEVETKDTGQFKAITIGCRDLSVEAETASGVSIAGVSAGLVTIECEDSSTVAVENVSSSRAVSVDCSTASTVTLTEVTGRELRAKAVNASTVTLGGIVDRVAYDCESVGTINATKLSAISGEAKAADTSTIRCRVKNLRKDISGYSSISNQ